VKTGIEGVGLQQLHVFDAPQRDDRGWVLSVAYLAVAPWAAIRAPALVVPVAERGALAFDHDQIVERALSTIRQNYRNTLIPTASSPSRSRSVNFTICTSTLQEKC
jgi:8-oxo-dGTP diphosphatase